MRVSTTVSADVDLEEVYSMCVPYDRAACTAEVRKYAIFLLERRAEDTDGRWDYPFADAIAGYLIANNFATGVLPRIE